jgi:cyclopropane fatty-acyl-phospholipid synthase-like methyltransferase
VIKDHNLPFSNNYFKKILALGVFHHISDEGVNNILKDFDRMLLPKWRDNNHRSTSSYRARKSLSQYYG